MEYMNQVWTDSKDVLVRLSLDDLGLLMNALNVAALEQRDRGFERAAGILWDLSDRIADVEMQAEADLAS